MYADLLRAAVEREDRAAPLPTVELVREVTRSGEADRPRGPAEGRTDLVGAVADELRYDAHLVQLCRRFGVEVDLAAFGCPKAERDRLRAALGALGVLPPVGSPSHEGAGTD